MKIYNEESIVFMKDEIKKQTLRIAESIGFTVIEDKGKRSSLCCPYHSAPSNEKGEHSKFHKDSNSVYCYYSNCSFNTSFPEGADAIKLLAFDSGLNETGQDFFVLLERGMDLLGLPIPEGSTSELKKEDLEAIKRKNLIKQCRDEFAKLTIEYLRNADFSNPAVKYLVENRELSVQTYYSSLYGATHPTDKKWAKKNLIKKGFSLDIIKDSGLLNRNEDDLFQKRIMVFETKFRTSGINFNLEDLTVTYMQGRSYDPDCEKGYRFLFQKNSKFDSFYKYQNLRLKKRIILAEAVFDADSINQIMGDEIAGAPFGTGGLSDIAISNMKKSPAIQEIYFCYDNDENFAGQMGAIKKAKKLLDSDKIIRFILLPREKDPNDLLKDGMSKSQFEDLIDRALTIEEFEILLLCHKALSKKGNKKSAQFDVLRDLDDYLGLLDSKSPMFEKILLEVSSLIDVSYSSLVNTYEIISGKVSQKQIQQAVHMYFLKERKFPFVSEEGRPTKEKDEELDLLKLVPLYLKSIPINSHQYQVINFNTGELGYKVSKNKIKIYCLDRRGNVVTKNL